MKQKFQILMAATVLFVITLTGCKKNDTQVDFATELSTHSDDQSRFANEAEAIDNDANTTLDNYFAFNGREANTLLLPCDATVTVDSISNPKKITITYNGLNCQGTRTRTGVVVLTLPGTTRWRDVGAVLTVSIQNLKITRLSDNKSITINGTRTVTNVTGGLIRNLATLGTITHTVASNGMSITFDDATQRNWQVAKKRVFTYNNGIVITTTGNASVDGFSNVSEWGTNRFGNAFVTTITQPMVIRQDCNFRLVRGQVTHNKMAATVVVTFGLDAAGNPITCPSGVFYFKLVFTGANGIVHTIIIPY